jgi:hypothetical protein
VRCVLSSISFSVSGASGSIRFQVPSSLHLEALGTWHTGSPKQVGEIKIYCPLISLSEIRSQIHSNGEAVATSIEIWFWNQQFQRLGDRILRATDLNKSEKKKSRSPAKLDSFPRQEHDYRSSHQVVHPGFQRWEQPQHSGLGAHDAVTCLGCSLT